MNTFDFKRQLVMSTGVSVGEDISQLLLAQIPGALKVIKANERDDRSGTDYWIEHKRGTPISVDTKIRKEDPVETRGKDDLALETWSVVGKKIGWTLDEEKRTDFILWWFPTGRWVLVPFAPLQAVFKRRHSMWTSRYPKFTQATAANGNSGGWKSECVFVPRDVVLDAIRSDFGGAPLHAKRKHVYGERPPAAIFVDEAPPAPRAPPTPLEAFASQLTGALGPRGAKSEWHPNGRPPTNDDNRTHAIKIATLIMSRGWPTADAFVQADIKRRPGCRLLRDIINDGYPIDRVTAFLDILGAP